MSCFQGNHSITTMKTILYALYTFGVTTGAVSLDSYRLDPGTLFTALAVAVLFAFALHDGRRTVRALPATPVTRFPTRRTEALDLAA